MAGVTRMQVPCSACGGDSFSPLFEVAGHSYVTCSQCASARLDPLPSRDPVDLYDSTYFIGGHHGGYLDYDADAVPHQHNAASRLERVAGVIAHGPQHLIDIGCATGYVLDEAVARGWTVVGVDVSAYARQRSGARGHTAVADLPSALDAGPRPTIVTAFQVLEHMRDPAEVIAQIVAALEPGGVLAIETWDRTSRVARLFGRHWQQASPPSVIHLFSRRGITLMIQRQGAQLVSIERTTKEVSVGRTISAASERWPELARPLRALASDNPVTRSTIHYRLGDLVTAIARVRE